MTDPKKPEIQSIPVGKPPVELGKGKKKPQPGSGGATRPVDPPKPLN